MDFDNKVKNQLQNYLQMKQIISNQSVWHAQTGGHTNKVWRLVGEEDLICKLYLETKNNPLFNNIPEAEYECLLWLDGSDIAPKSVMYCYCLFYLVTLGRFEPPTCALGGGCSIQLSHRAIINYSYVYESY